MGVPADCRLLGESHECFPIADRNQSGLMLNLIVAVDDACCIVVLVLFNVPRESSNSRVE